MAKTREEMIKEVISMLSRLGTDQQGLENNLSLQEIPDDRLYELHRNLTKLMSALKLE